MHAAQSRAYPVCQFRRQHDARTATPAGIHVHKHVADLSK